MKIATMIALLCAGACLAAPRTLPAQTNNFTDAERASIQTFIEGCVVGSKAAMVVGLIDESGKNVLSAGTLDNGTDGRVDGDSMFFIGSVSKTFTALLLLEMADRGEVKLDDPVAKYLPASVKVPTHGGNEITLLNLATHSSGLPSDPSNMTGDRDREQLESYTVEQMYAFLSGFELSRDPGAEFSYSNVGMALLGHALERRAGIPYEWLVVERIFRPLDMTETRNTLARDQRQRLAMGHDDARKPSTPWKLQAYAPAGDIHSSANELLKYAAAHAGLAETPLKRLMDQSHVFRYVDNAGRPGTGAYSSLGRTAMDWVDRNAFQPPGMELLGHAGGAGSYHAWVGFDKKQRRGVVALSTGNSFSVEAIGWTILQRLPLTEGRKTTFAREIIGVGVALEVNELRGGLRITKVMPNSPAAKAGLSDGLVIAKIDGVETSGKTLSQCVDLIRGEAGTTVRLELLDSEGMAPRTVELTRQRFMT